MLQKHYSQLVIISVVHLLSFMIIIIIIIFSLGWQPGCCSEQIGWCYLASCGSSRSENFMTDIQTSVMWINWLHIWNLHVKHSCQKKSINCTEMIYLQFFNNRAEPCFDTTPAFLLFQAAFLKALSLLNLQTHYQCVSSLVPSFSRTIYFFSALFKRPLRSCCWLDREYNKITRIWPHKVLIGEEILKCTLRSHSSPRVWQWLRAKRRKQALKEVSVRTNWRAECFLSVNIQCEACADATSHFIAFSLSAHITFTFDIFQFSCQSYWKDLERENNIPAKQCAHTHTKKHIETTHFVG